MPNDESVPEVERAFAALASDTERGLLLSGPELRRQAARRHSRRVAVTTGAAAVLVVGAVGAGWAVTKTGGNDRQNTGLPPAVSGTGTASAPTVSLPPSPTPSSIPPTTTSAPPTTTAPTTRPPAIPKSIPARALLSASDTGIADLARVDDPFEQLEFCSKAKFPSEADVGVRATVRMFYRGPKSEPSSVPDDTVYNTVTVYREDGAEKYLSELRQAVESCPTGKVGSSEAQFDSLGSLGSGDESILIDRSYEARDGEGEPVNNGSRNHTYIAAVRVGDAVTLVDGRGYEGWGAARADFQKQLAGKAAARLEDWRG